MKRQSATKERPKLMPDERPAPIAGLSRAARRALIECLKYGSLHKQNGFWRGAPTGKANSGITVADLRREGLLMVTKNDRVGFARLTERGQWFAKTLSASETDEVIE